MFTAQLLATLLSETLYMDLTAKLPPTEDWMNPPCQQIRQAQNCSRLLQVLPPESQCACMQNQLVSGTQLQRKIFRLNVQRRFEMSEAYFCSNNAIRLYLYLLRKGQSKDLEL
mmetsp:Transcript_4576/g.7738  ORF Transcript_4576/g.7738 Transcript_4576/m.7738 type:complete len:113 (-) Transcript_4576:1295-1633(-)